MLPSHHFAARTAGLTLEQHIPGQKIVQSTGEAWKEAEAQIFCRPVEEEEVLVPAVADPLLVWVLSGEAKIEERELSGQWLQSDAKAGCFFLTQTEAPYLMRWKAKQDTPFEVLHLYLGLPLVNRAARSLGLTPSRCRMRDVSGARDTFIAGVLSGLVAEIRSDTPDNRLFINGLLESLTIHLLRCYATPQSTHIAKGVHLPAWKLHKALSYMEEHLALPFDLDSLAALCGMSRFHFSRSFHTTMGQSPSSWFIRRRVEQAAILLRQTTLSVIEVALSVGYENPSHFSNVFRKTMGVTPRHYRKRQEP